MQKKLTEDQRLAARESARLLIHSFKFEDTPDGLEFWESVHDRLYRIGLRGTTDGKPWVEPVRVPTDEDAKQRPRVMVQDFETDQWSLQTLLYVSPKCDRGIRFLAVDDNGETDWFRQCRFPTEYELASLLKIGNHVADAVAAKIEQPKAKEWVKCDPDRWTNANEFAAVPEDRDSYHRPYVMVRDTDGSWYRRTLVAVASGDSGDCRFITMNNLGSIERWADCRFPAECE